MMTQTLAAVLATILHLVGTVTGPVPEVIPNASSESTAFPGDLSHSYLPDIPPIASPMPNDPQPIELATTLPNDATPASPEQLRQIRTGTWVAVKEPRSTKIVFRKYVADNPSELHYLMEEFAAGAVPADLQEFYGGASCNHRNQGLWFEVNVLKTTEAGITTLMGCSPQQDAQDAEALQYIDSDPKVYLDKAGYVYLVRPDGVASAWKRP